MSGQTSNFINLSVENIASEKQSATPYRECIVFWIFLYSSVYKF